MLNLIEFTSPEAEIVFDIALDKPRELVSGLARDKKAYLRSPGGFSFPGCRAPVHFILTFLFGVEHGEISGMATALAWLPCVARFSAPPILTDFQILHWKRSMSTMRFGGVGEMKKARA